MMQDRITTEDLAEWEALAEALRQANKVTQRFGYRVVAEKMKDSQDAPKATSATTLPARTPFPKTIDGKSPKEISAERGKAALKVMRGNEAKKDWTPKALLQEFAKVGISTGNPARAPRMMQRVLESLKKKEQIIKSEKGEFYRLP